MTLASTLAHSVDSGVRKRGQQYFRDGKVSVTSSDRDVVAATVFGSDEYHVLLTRESKRLYASCTCPYIADRGEPCQHVWATILAADAKGGLRGPGGGLPRVLVAEVAVEEDWEDPDEGEIWDEDEEDVGDEEEEEDDGWIGGRFEDKKRPRPPQPAPVPRTPQLSMQSRPPVWRDLFATISREEAPFTSADEIVYVIDAEATRQVQRLKLDLLGARRKLDGTLGKSYPLRVSRSQIPRLPDPADREVLALLAGAPQSSPWRTWYSYASVSETVPSSPSFPEPAAATLVPLLCATGRCRLRRSPGSEGEPLVWDDAEPWELWLEVRENEAQDCEVTGSLRRNGERLGLTEPALVLRSGLVFTGGRAARLDVRGDFGWIPLLQSLGTLRVPAADRDELLERLVASPRMPRLDLPEAMRIQEVRPVPMPRLRLRPATEGESYREWPRAELSFLYDGREVPAGAPGRGLYEREDRQFLLRDPEAEQRAADRLPDLGFRPARNGSETLPMPIPANRVAVAVRTLLSEGWQVEAKGKLYRSAGNFQLAVSSGVDWFELHGEAQFSGANPGTPEIVRLPELLAALERGDGFVPLSDGTLGLLPEEWLKRLAPVAGLGQTHKDHVRFQPVQACLLDAWLAGEPEVTCDAAFARARNRLHRFEGVAPADPPPGFQGELRDYQRAGLGWLHFLRDFGFGGCLADDMGLGKTVQVLALLEARRTARTRPTRQKPGPSLVVVPRSLVFNWLAEAARFTPRLRVLDYTGTGRARDEDAFKGYDLVLTTYGTLRRDLATLRQTEFDYVILDEAQAIKNADSQTAKAARLLRGRHRLALSGTPIENHLGELWSLLEFLNPGMLGASPLLRARSTELRDPDAETRTLLARALRPFLLRRTKEQVAPELPAKVEQTLYCELPPKQRRLYDELRDHYRNSLSGRIEAQGLGRTKILVLEALLRLRQAACHPGLLDRDRSDEPAAKLDLLLPQLREVLAEGHKALVFSQFTSFLALVRRHLDRGGDPLPLSRRPHPRPPGAGRAVPVRCRLPPVPDQPQGRRAGSQPDRRRLRLPPRPLVEPGGRSPGHRPRPPHRPDAAGLRLPPRRARHGRGEDPAAPGKQARPRRRHHPGRPEPDRPPQPGGSGAAAVVADLPAPSGAPPDHAIIRR